MVIRPEGEQEVLENARVRNAALVRGPDARAAARTADAQHGRAIALLLSDFS
jgi:hypothetical protein